MMIQTSIKHGQVPGRHFLVTLLRSMLQPSADSTSITLSLECDAENTFAELVVASRASLAYQAQQGADAAR